MAPSAEAAGGGDPSGEPTGGDVVVGVWMGVLVGVGSLSLNCVSAAFSFTSRSRSLSSRSLSLRCFSSSFRSDVSSCCLSLSRSRFSPPTGESGRVCSGE